MKHSFILLFVCLVQAGFSQKNIDQVFRKYKNDEGVMNMNFTGDVLKMINNADSKIKSTVEAVNVLVFKNNDDLDQSDKVKIDALLKTDKYDLLINVKNKSQKIKLYAIDSGKYLNKVYAHINSPDMNAYFVMSGKIIFEELSKLGMDFNGDNPLKLLDTNK